MKRNTPPPPSQVAELPPALNEETQAMALYLAMVVRNAMEDFHVKHLSDAQMRELNPIIRNALATALYAWQQQAQNPVAGWYVEHHLRMIPPYWEPPVLLTTFQERFPDLSQEQKERNDD